MKIRKMQGESNIPAFSFFPGFEFSSVRLMRLVVPILIQVVVFIEVFHIFVKNLAGLGVDGVNNSHAGFIVLEAAAIYGDGAASG